MHTVLTKCLETAKKELANGNVATYIPELALVSPELLGVYIRDVKGGAFGQGDYLHRFTIQSISKIVILLCAMEDSTEEELYKKVSLEPTADGFNSIVNLETKNHNKPLNPFINSGAIAMITLLSGATMEDKFMRVLDLARELTENPDLYINHAVYISEKATGSRNRALAYYMKSTGVIDGDVEDILDVYFRICSISVNCVELASIALAFAKDGMLNGNRLFPQKHAKIVKTIMALCGMYDESGRFAVRVGAPSKSGVGGGILTVVPGRMGIGVFGPSLNEKGSSIGGIKLLEELSRELDLSIY